MESIAFDAGGVGGFRHLSGKGLFAALGGGLAAGDTPGTHGPQAVQSRIRGHAKAQPFQSQLGAAFGGGVAIVRGKEFRHRVGEVRVLLDEGGKPFLRLVHEGEVGHRPARGCRRDGARTAHSGHGLYRLEPACRRKAHQPLRHVAHKAARGGFRAVQFRGLGLFLAGHLALLPRQRRAIAGQVHAQVSVRADAMAAQCRAHVVDGLYCFVDGAGYRTGQGAGRFHNPPSDVAGDAPHHGTRCLLRLPGGLGLVRGGRTRRGGLPVGGATAPAVTHAAQHVFCSKRGLRFLPPLGHLGGKVVGIVDRGQGAGGHAVGGAIGSATGNGGETLR